MCKDYHFPSCDIKEQLYIAQHLSNAHMQKELVLSKTARKLRNAKE